MPHFSYQAIDENGKTKSGVIDADSVDIAANLLAAKGFVPTSVEPKKEAGYGWLSLKGKSGKVPIQDLIIFTKQFRTMFKAGLPILSLLESLGNQTENANLRNAIKSIAKEIKDGATLYESFKKQSPIFSELYCSMIRAGEVSGALQEVLDRLLYIIEHEHTVKSNVKSALQYPKMVVIALGIAFFILLTFVIPKFVGIFQKAGIDLPLPTKICMFMYNVLANYWYLLIGGTAGLVILLKYLLKTEKGRFVKDSLLLKLPIIGPLYQKSAMARFASIFSILQSSGLQVLDSIDIVSRTIGNAAISREFDQIKGLMEEGQGISKPLKSARYFTPMVISMVAMGEESGTLDTMLHEVSVHYDDEVNYSVSKLSESITPILIVGLTVVVGFFALAIFMPMWDLTKIAK